MTLSKENLANLPAELSKALDYVLETLTTAEYYGHTVSILNYDRETICPEKAIEEQGDLMAFMENQAFRLLKDPHFIEEGEYLYAHRNELSEGLRVLAELLHRDYLKTADITPEMNLEFSKTYNKAFGDWLQAKEKSDFSLFADSLAKVREANLKDVSLRRFEEDRKPATSYDVLLDDYERGMTTADLDEAFGECRERLVPLLGKIRKSPKKIRTDFLSRTVTDEQQKQMADYLLRTIGFDFKRGAISTAEHPFTDGLGRNDARITTHYYPDMFSSSMFSVIHEGGHALFEQLQPQADYKNHITRIKTMGQHESVSRFYENRIGRSEEFIHLIYPETKKIFPQVFEDVSEREFYEAMNLVEPSLIRTEADEFTYTFHIIIRYEIEKRIVNGNAKIEELPALWNDLYEKYLGIRPDSDRNGILQDVHWTGGFGYFPAYAIGNMYNAMYTAQMEKELDLSAAVSGGDFEAINDWMAANVFAKADTLAPKDWIRDITGREFTPKDFLDYIEKKYMALYEL
ncbi:MAG: carboxypeptidase M32 [Eubacterium sp.]|nr:carboxypeptidase M32 [Eubacterium sp.]